MRHLKKIIAFLIVTILFASCVSTKKYKASEAARMKTEDEVKNLTVQKSLLEQDTTAYGLKFRALMLQKNFLEQTTASEIKYLKGRVEEQERILNEQEKLIAELQEDLSLYQSGWQERQKMLNELMADLSGEFVGLKLDSPVTEIEKGKLWLILPAEIIFDGDKTVLSPTGEEIIATMADVFGDYNISSIEVEVHSSNLPEGTAFADEMEYTNDRAKTILTSLTKSKKLPVKLVGVIGMGKAQPLGSNETIEGRTANNRVEFIITPSNNPPAKQETN